MGIKIIKIASPSQLLILFIIIFLLTLPLILVKNALVRTQVFYGVKFPNGAISFADEVVAYQPIIYISEYGLPNVKAPFNQPKTALGIPNSSNSKNIFIPINKRNDVSLGIGGSLTLQFKNNLLTGSGDNKIDLWIFEAGERTETVFVEISKDGINWVSVGQINQSSQGIDIDQFGWGTDDFFAYVRLTDDPLQGDHDGIWDREEWIGWGGADIDAVGAISSVSLLTTANHSFLFPPIFKWILLVIAILGSGFITTYFVKKSNYN